jgi:hypothetical protein
MWGWFGGHLSFCFYYSCFASNFLSFSSTETPKLAVFLFHETTETNPFVSDTVETSFGSSFDSFHTYELSFIGYPS